MSLVIIVALIALWVAAGWALLAWYARPGTGDLRRIVSDRVRGLGQPLTITLRATPPIDAASVTDHDVVLLLDRSQSMGAAPGSPFREMLRAAESFTLRMPANIQVAVVAFDDDADCISPFVADKRRAVRGIGTIAPGNGTSISNALNRAGEILNTSRREAHRVVVLFSDGFDTLEDVRAAAARLRSHPAEPAIYCASFGGEETQPLMTEIAGTPERVFHTENFEGIVDLFDTLAAEVSGQRAIAGLLHEEVQAPCPFRLQNLGGSTPVDVHVAESSTHVVWPLPQFTNVVTPVSYVVEPVCVGWHSVVAGGGSVTWRLPDGRSETRDGPRATRVLVLPAWATWAWPIANPILMLLLRPLLRCRPPLGDATGPAVAALPEIPLPPSLPAPADPPYRPSVRPAMVVGLGPAGRSILRHLRAAMIEREISAGTVSLLAVALGSGGVADADTDRLKPDAAVSVDADIWPYIDALRGQPVPDLRSWLPLRKWLREATPLTTLRGATADRGKARLFALLNPDPPQQTLASLLAGLPGDDVKVIVVGGAEETEVTGLAAEVAHIVAVLGLASSLVLLRPRPERRGDRGISAFGDEMTRLLVRRGDPVASDRGDVTEVARQMFDRVFVLGEAGADDDERERAAATLIWSLLAYRPVDDRLPPLRDDNVYNLQLKSYLAPQASLWALVRERLLNDVILGEWLGRGEGAPDLPAADQQQAEHLAAIFWSGSIMQRPAPRLVTDIAQVERGNAPGIALINAGRDGPFNKPYHEQKTYCDAERHGFGYYLEAWCAVAFEQAAENGTWGIPELLAAAASIQRAISGAQEKLRPYATDDDAVKLVAFTLSMVVEVRALISRLVTTLEEWSRAFAGRQAAPEQGANVETSIRAGLRDASRDFPPRPEVRARLEPLYLEWRAAQQPNLLTNLRFRGAYLPEPGAMRIELRLFDQYLSAGDDVARRLRSVLDPFRAAILRWPDQEWLIAQDRQAIGGGQWVAVGLYADGIFGPAAAQTNERDPAVAIGINSRTATIKDALDAHAVATADDYIWAEEANAERIRELIRGLSQVEPYRFSPLAIRLLGHPSSVMALLQETASGQLTLEAGNIVLRRGGGRYVLATLAGHDATVMDFDNAAEQAILLGEDRDGNALPAAPVPAPVATADWRGELDRIVEELNNSPIGRALREAPEWAMWLDLARGVFLLRVVR